MQLFSQYVYLRLTRRGPVEEGVIRSCLASSPLRPLPESRAQECNHARSTTSTSEPTPFSLDHSANEPPCSEQEHFRDNSSSNVDDRTVSSKAHA